MSYPKNKVHPKQYSASPLNLEETNLSYQESLSFNFSHHFDFSQRSLISAGLKPLHAA